VLDFLVKAVIFIGDDLALSDKAFEVFLTKHVVEDFLGLLLELGLDKVLQGLARNAFVVVGLALLLSLDEERLFGISLLLLNRFVLVLLLGLVDSGGGGDADKEFDLRGLAKGFSDYVGHLEVVVVFNNNWLVISIKVVDGEGGFRETGLGAHGADLLLEGLVVIRLEDSFENFLVFAVDGKFDFDVEDVVCGNHSFVFSG